MLTFIIYNIIVKIVDLNHTYKDACGTVPNVKTKIFSILFVCMVSISLFQIAYAQTSSDSETQVTISDNLLNDPIAQDILKKIEQTKKMIADLEQKEYEKNQAQENLQKMRDMSVERLNQSLDEWERLWEKHSSRNSFETFVNKKPFYVQGIFWDQFEFREQKVHEGRTAMNQVLINGGTMQDAKNAYNKAATIQKIELIEMNAQFNVKHNLADDLEQNIFNSVGKAHLSPANNAKLTNLYSDYRLQPNYILANSDDITSSKIISETECEDGFVMVSRITSENRSCVDESTAQKWVNNGVNGIMISGNPLPISEIKTNPGTICEEGYQIVYHVETSEYQCVLESIAKDMIEQNIVEDHTLFDYISNKDILKIHEDTIFEINQKIKSIENNHNLKLKELESDYVDAIENEETLAKQMMQEIINEYKTENITKEDVSKQISEIRKKSEAAIGKLLDKKLDEINKLETNQKYRILKIIKGYENNSDINVDWDYLNKTPKVVKDVIEKKISNPVKVSLSNENIGDILLDDIDIVNSFGQRFDEIKTDHVLQIAASVTNSNEQKNDFAYVVEITDSENNSAQPAKWMTGTLNPDQTFNVSLSWMPEKIGEYKATISVGNSMNSIFQVADIEINVNPEGALSDDDYCKNGHELLFKYSDNSPICASLDTASKLINKGLAFA